MSQDREQITDGANPRSVSENIASTAPGIPDEALAPGEELPEPPSEEEEAQVRKSWEFRRRRTLCLSMANDQTLTP